MLKRNTDIELLDIIQSGNSLLEDAFREIFKRYSKRIYLFCWKFLSEKTLAEDITQETFLKLLKYMQDGKKVDNLKSFLFQIAKNLCINMKKVESRYDTILENYQDMYVDKTYENKELASLIESALNLLPEDHKEAFCLQMYSGLSYQEIAEINEVPVSTVRNWIVRAKAKLRKILSNYFEEIT